MADVGACFPGTIVFKLSLCVVFIALRDNVLKETSNA